MLPQTALIVVALVALCSYGVNATMVLLINHPPTILTIPPSSIPPVYFYATSYVEMQLTAPANVLEIGNNYTMTVAAGETVILRVTDGRACTPGSPGFTLFTTATPPAYIGRSACDPDGLSSSFVESFTSSLAFTVFNSTPIAITAGTIGYGLPPAALVINAPPTTFVVPAYTPNTLALGAPVAAAATAATTASSAAVTANTAAVAVSNVTGTAGSAFALLTAVNAANSSILPDAFVVSVATTSAASVAAAIAALSAAQAVSIATANGLMLAAQAAAAASATVTMPTLANAIKTQSIAIGAYNALYTAYLASEASATASSNAREAARIARDACIADNNRDGCKKVDAALEAFRAANAGSIANKDNALEAKNTVNSAQLSASSSVTAANAAVVAEGPVAPNALGLVTAAQAAVGVVSDASGTSGAAPTTVIAAMTVYAPAAGLTPASGTAVTQMTSATALNAVATAPENVLFSTIFKMAAIDAQAAAVSAANSAAIATNDAQAAVAVAAVAKTAADSSVVFVEDTPIYKSALAYKIMENAQEALIVIAASALTSYNAAIAAEAAAIDALAACNSDTLQCALSVPALAASMTAIANAAFNVAAAASVLTIASTAVTAGAAAVTATQTAAEVLAAAPMGFSRTFELTTSTIPARYAAVTIIAPCTSATDQYVIYAAGTIGALECAVAGLPASFTHNTTTTGLTSYYVASGELTLATTNLTIAATYDTIPIEDNGRPTVIPAIRSGDASATYSFDIALGETVYMSITMDTGCSPALTAFNVYNFSTLLGLSSCLVLKSIDAIDAGQYLFQADLTTPGTANIVITNELVGMPLGSGSITLS